jgi:hypothetical protein
MVKNEERRKYVLVVINDKIKIRKAKVEGEEGFFLDPTTKGHLFGGV